MNSLRELGKALLAKEVKLTFSLESVTVGASTVKKSIKYRAKTDQGDYVEFWEKNMDLVVEETEPGKFAVKAGVTRLDSGDLIPAGSGKANVEWS